MFGGRGTAIAGALLALLALAGCGVGLGPGASVSPVELTVTRDFGREQLLHEPEVEVRESDTVMRVLEGEAEITTRYGGGFVQSIDGLAEEHGGDSPMDWLFFVDGVESSVGAAEYPLRGGERIWWDYRDWGAATRVSAVVGSWPAPFEAGYDGRERPVSLLCEAPAPSCEAVADALREAGADPREGEVRGAIRVLVGPWRRLRDDPTAALVEAGPQASGVYADFEGGGGTLVGLDEDGEPARAFGPDAGLVAALRRYEDPPTWLVTGTGAAGVAAAAELLGEEHLRDRYAVAVEGGEEAPLPLR